MKYIILFMLILSGCASLDKSEPLIRIEGSGVNDSQVIQAKEMIINKGVVELR